MMHLEVVFGGARLCDVSAELYGRRAQHGVVGP
jgi:hypothetical protein